jgi:hypothetical protein
MQAILSRLGAAKLVFQDEALVHKAEFSAVQKGAAISTIKSAVPPLSAVQKAEVAEKVLSVGFVQKDAQEILLHLQPKVDTPPRRRGLQDFRMPLIEYFDAATWETLQKQEVSSNSKLEILIEQAISLGLRLPNEFSYKFIASVFMICGQLANEASPRSTKMHLLKYCKAEFGRHVRRAPATNVHIDRLLSPMELRVVHPQHFEQCCGQRVIVQPPKSIVEAVLRVEESYGCRDRNVPCMPQLSDTSSAPLMQMMMQMFNMMQNKNQNQQIELQFAPDRQPTAPKALKALMSPPSLSLAASPSSMAPSSISSSPSSTASKQSVSPIQALQDQSPAGEQHPSLQSPRERKVRFADDELKSSLAPSSSASTSPSQSPSSDEISIIEARASKRLQDFMNVLDERKQEKEVTKKTAAAKKKASAEASTSARDSAAAACDAEGGRAAAARGAERGSAATSRGAERGSAAAARGAERGSGSTTGARGISAAGKATAAKAKASTVAKATSQAAAASLFVPDAVKKKSLRFSKPSYSVERSRSQVQLRSGFRGTGQARTVKFGDGHDFADEDSAIVAAAAWCKLEEQRQKRQKLL